MNLFSKILLYNVSLVPLYILFIIQKVELKALKVYFIEYKNIDYYKSLFFQNLIPIVLFSLIILSYIIFLQLTKELTTTEKLPKRFSNIKNIDFNHLTFIATYIIPLLAFKLDTLRDIFFLVVLLSFIGVIYIKTNLYYLNPIFIIFGIRLFSATDKNGNDCILMTKEKKLENNEMLHFTMLGDLYYVYKGRE